MEVISEMMDEASIVNTLVRTVEMTRNRGRGAREYAVEI